MSIGFWQIAIVVILVVLLFGRGKISSLMGDVAKGIKSFKKGMSTDVTDETQDVTDETHQKNISEDNQDSTNQDSTNQDSTNQDSNNKE
jgi:sec-independent protein translocase protein TatA